MSDFNIHTFQTTVFQALPLQPSLLVGARSRGKFPESKFWQRLPLTLQRIQFSFFFKEHFHSFLPQNFMNYVFFSPSGYIVCGFFILRWEEQTHFFLSLQNSSSLWVGPKSKIIFQGIIFLILPWDNLSFCVPQSTSKTKWGTKVHFLTVLKRGEHMLSDFNSRAWTNGLCGLEYWHPEKEVGTGSVSDSFVNQTEPLQVQLVSEECPRKLPSFSSQRVITEK